ncbi:MAG: hypothetical protein CMJ39_12040 [Phycisphaerae bacterium]|nr:hypothetical protein [Phycisphaerae bacterium]|tara:strand:+ start:101 stop:883 length:783 start_codon:yes stop_codon:yes gene_type:complete
MAQSVFMTESLQPGNLSWAALLGKWMDFAKASTVLPDTVEGHQWRASVAPMITLQGITFAMAELEQVEASQRLLGWDRGELLVDQASIELDECWGPDLPSSVLETIQSAESALTDVIDRFTPVLVAEAGAPSLMPSVPLLEPLGASAVVAAGTTVMPGAPIAWWSEVDFDQLRSLELPGILELWQSPIQVWRHWDEQDVFTEDVVTSLDAEHEQALPLLVPRVLEGIPLSDPLPSPGDVASFYAQRLGMKCIPVRLDLSP